MRRILLFPWWVDKSSAISADRLGPGGYTCDTHCGPAISIVLNALADTAKFALATLALAKIARAPSGAPFAGPQELVTFLVRPLDAVVNRLRFHPKILLL